MRRSFASGALLAALAAGACTDNAPTGTELSPRGSGPVLNQESLTDYIDRLTLDLFPKGLETATGSRWQTVKDKLAANDFDGATKHLRDLGKYVKLKTNDVTLTSEFKSKEHAAATLVYSMAVFVYKGPTEPAPATGGDVAFEIVPAGEAATIVTPAQHAALDIPAGSTNEDRLFTIIQDPALYPGHCNGPLPTKLCQYPLFYDIASFPSVRFNNPVGVAVCAVTDEDRGPLDKEGDETVHHRLRLARPYSAGATTPGGTLHPAASPTIEILPLRSEQRGLTDCSDIPTPVASLTPRGGWLGHAQRGMLAVAHFVGRALTPKNLYAYDNGPEHETMGLGSPINAVDPSSQPDLEATGLAASTEAVVGDEIVVDFTVANVSRRSGGQSTGAAGATTATVYLVRTVAEGDDVGSAGTEEHALTTVNVVALRPDASHVVDDLAVTVPADLDPGTWTLEVRVAANSGLAEVTLDNNRTSRQIEVDPLDIATTITFVDPANFVTHCDGPSGCGQAIVQNGYIVQSFWYDPPQIASPHWTSGHLHPEIEGENWFERHHWQGDEARQGVRIRRQDGKAFTLKSIDYRSATTPFEVGTTAITSIVGTPPVVTGYTEFPVTNAATFQTLQFSGFVNVTEVWITMRNDDFLSADWDNIVLSGPPVTALATILQLARPTFSVAKAEGSTRHRVVEGRDVVDP